MEARARADEKSAPDHNISSLSSGCREEGLTEI